MKNITLYSVAEALNLGWEPSSVFNLHADSIARIQAPAAGLAYGLAHYQAHGNPHGFFPVVLSSDRKTVLFEGIDAKDCQVFIDGYLTCLRRKEV
jgi:hypothetical protein